MSSRKTSGFSPKTKGRQQKVTGIRLGTGGVGNIPIGKMEGAAMVKGNVTD